MALVLSQKMPTNTFDLMGLPIELICHISTYLPTEDLGNLRQSCRAVEKILFDLFAAEYFSIRQVFIHPLSLMNLCDISKHPHFSKVVKKVIFCNDRVTQHDPSQSNQRDIWFEQKYCFESGEYRQLLEAALKNLPNCRTFEQRDFVSSKHRARDGTHWRSYGVKYLERTGGNRICIHPNRGQPELIKPNSGVLNAIVDASKAGFRLESFEIINQQPSWDWSDFHIPIYSEHAFKSAFASIKTLMISVFYQRGLGSTTSKFKSFLDILPQLEHLRVNLDNRQYTSDTPQDDFLETISNKSLRNLELGKLSISVTGLESLLSKQSETLEKLTFFKVTLCSPGVGPVILPVSGDTTTWHSLMTPLKSVKKLKSVTFNEIYGTMTSPVYWKDPEGINVLGMGLVKSWDIAADSKEKMELKIDELKAHLVYNQDNDEDGYDSEEDFYGDSDVYDSDMYGFYEDEDDEEDEF